MRCITCDLFTEDINHKFFVKSEFQFIVIDEIKHFIYEDYNTSTKIICLDYER